MYRVPCLALSINFLAVQIRTTVANNKTLTLEPVSLEIMYKVPVKSLAF